MKKQITTLLLAVNMIFCINAADTANQFPGLTRPIDLAADAWITNFISKLTVEEQLTYLNLFVQPSQNSMDATMKCVQHLQANSKLTSSSEELEKNMQKIVETYIVAMQKKFESLKKSSQKDLKNFLEKLEKKIYELIAHFYMIHYTKLYKHIEQQNPAILYYMFDEQGIINQDKRVRPLPKPTN